MAVIRREALGFLYCGMGQGGEKMLDKIRKGLYIACDIMELVMVLAVICGIVIAVITLGPELRRYWEHRLEMGAFLMYLDAIFDVVIGIEFMKMLCKPSVTNIIEVLVFLIARHMIVQTTTPLENLLSVVSISILFLFRHVIMTGRSKEGRHVDLLHTENEEDE